jgi:hypothetical protein
VLKISVNGITLERILMMFHKLLKLNLYPSPHRFARQGGVIQNALTSGVWSPSPLGEGFRVRAANAVGDVFP